MIESLYWKEELARIVRSISPVAKPRRWSERAVCTVERDLMIGFFIVRRMIELQKVSSRTAEMQLDVYVAPVIRSVTKLSQHRLDENYNWNSERAERISVLYACNQCIHAYLSFVDRGRDRNWSDLLVVSDYKRNNMIWRFPFTTIIQLFDTASDDWPHEVYLKFDPKLGDYTVTTN